MRLVLVAVMLVVLGACGSDLHVESSTSWSGHIGGTGSGRSVDGSGDRTFSIDSDACWSFQKGTEEGTLRVYSEDKFIVSTTNGDETTTAAYGVVNGCNS